jgi:hypothetical protein
MPVMNPLVLNAWLHIRNLELPQCLLHRDHNAALNTLSLG